MDSIIVPKYVDFPLDEPNVFYGPNSIIHLSLTIDEMNG
jgi:hypothetical protein